MNVYFRYYYHIAAQAKLDIEILRLSTTPLCHLLRDHKVAR